MHCRLLVATAFLLGCNHIASPDATLTDASADRTESAIDTGIDTGNFTVPDVGFPDVSRDAPTRDANGPAYCSVASPVAGAVVPAGFCISTFISGSSLREPRNLAMAPNGDLFVSAPSMVTGAGIANGPGAIVVLSDDNHDGAAESTTFASIPDVHGLAFRADGLYFTTAAGVFRTAYTMGQRTEDASSRVMVAPFTGTSTRWTHGLGITPGGSIYATTGVWGSTCPDANVGFVDRVLTSSGSMTHQLIGFRNPMFIRCHPFDETCVIAELGDDGGGGYGAHEKLLAVHDSGDYGYACCAGPGQPAFGVSSTCSDIAHEEVPFPLNSTPFGMDWERGVWPSPYNSGLFLAFHGSFYSSTPFQGTRIAFATTDPTTDLPNSGFEDFVTGFASGGTLSRATSVVFSPDGRLFFADDTAGGVYWVAPVDLRSFW